MNSYSVFWATNHAPPQALLAMLIIPVVAMGVAVALEKFLNHLDKKKKNHGLESDR